MVYALVVKADTIVQRLRVDNLYVHLVLTVVFFKAIAPHVLLGTNVTRSERPNAASDTIAQQDPLLALHALLDIW